MRQPTKNDITNKLNNVIIGKISREDVGEWAMGYIHNDTNVEIEDINAWHYLVAVSNIDEMISPDEYLYDKNDIIKVIESYQ